MDNLHYKNLQSAIDCHEMLASIIRYLLDLRKNCVRVVCNIAGSWNCRLVETQQIRSGCEFYDVKWSKILFNGKSDSRIAKKFEFFQNFQMNPRMWGGELRELDKVGFWLNIINLTDFVLKYKSNKRNCEKCYKICICKNSGSSEK